MGGVGPVGAAGGARPARLGVYRKGLGAWAGLCKPVGRGRALGAGRG